MLGMADSTTEPLPSTLPQISIKLCGSGFESEAQATELATYVRAFAYVLGQHWPLDRLDGITIADNYDEELAAVDRGFEASEPVARSDDYVQGVAMAVPVKRDGVIKSHLVLFAAMMRPLLDEKSEGFKTAQYMLAHELAHVADVCLIDEAMPGLLLSFIDDELDRALDSIVRGAWSEYFATSASARFDPGLTAAFAETLVKALETELPALEKQRLKYQWQHHDLNVFWHQCLARVRRLLTLSGYVIGHLHGLGADVDAECPALAKALQDAGWRPLFDTLATTLKALDDSHNEWNGFDAFRPLHKVGNEALELVSIFVTKEPNGTLYINVP